MIRMNALPITHLTILAAGLIGAAITDIARRRVPNVISAFVFVTGLAVRGYDLGVKGALGGVAASVILLFALYGLWRARAVGGGDVKLAAAVGAWIGLSNLFWFVLASAVAGGVVAVACYFLAPASTRADVRANLVLAGLRGDLPPPEAVVQRKPAAAVPYAVAIAAGAAVALLAV
jgi:prepilin peptidase CpaA